MSVQLELVWLYTRTVSLSHTHAGSQRQTDRRQQLNSMVSTNYALETNQLDQALDSKLWIPLAFLAQGLASHYGQANWAES